MTQLYISIALSTRANSIAESYWRSHASTAIRRINAKTLLDSTVVSTRAVISREPQIKSIYGAAVQPRVERQGERQIGSLLAQPRIISGQKAEGENPLDDTAVSSRAVISREQQSKSICGAALYQRRVKQQGERQSGSILGQQRIISDQKTEHATPAGQHGGGDQSDNQPRAAKLNHIWRSCISTSCYNASGQRTNAYLAQLYIRRHHQSKPARAQPRPQAPMAQLASQTAHLART